MIFEGGVEVRQPKKTFPLLMACGRSLTWGGSFEPQHSAVFPTNIASGLGIFNRRHKWDLGDLDLLMSGGAKSSYEASSVKQNHSLGWTPFASAAAQQQRIRHALRRLAALHRSEA